MHWIAALGLALLLAAMALLAWVVPETWSNDTEKENVPSGEPSVLSVLIRGNRARRSLRTRQTVLAIGAMLLLTAIFLIFLAPPPPVNIQSIVVSGTVERGGPLIANKIPASFWERWEVWAVITLIIALFVIGFLTLRRFPLAGSASLIAAATLTSQLHLISGLTLVDHINFPSWEKSSSDQSQNYLTREQVEKIVQTQIELLKSELIQVIKSGVGSSPTVVEVKPIDDAKIDRGIQHLADISEQIKKWGEKAEGNVDDETVRIMVETKLNTYLSQIGGLAPEHLGFVRGFDPGSPDFKSDPMNESVSIICDRWRNRAKPSDDRTRALQKEALVLVVGSTDRMPLGSLAKARYEANTGLARARAETIKSKIKECGIEESRILSLVTGPRNTPKPGTPLDQEDYASDRTVDVWAIWSSQGLRQNQSK